MKLEQQPNITYFSNSSIHIPDTDVAGNQRETTVLMRKLMLYLESLPDMTPVLRQCHHLWLTDQDITEVLPARLSMHMILYLVEAVRVVRHR